MFREIRRSEKITERTVTEKPQAPKFNGPAPTITIEEAKNFWDELFASMEAES